MSSIKLEKNVVQFSDLLDVHAILPHEEVVIDRLESLIIYLKTIKPYIIIPSILICDKTNMIIDGHHRYYALREIGFNKVPVTYIDYSSELIVPDLDGKVKKEMLIDSAVNKIMLPPKSSFHHVLDIDYHFQPIILLSSLFRLDYF